MIFRIIARAMMLDKIKLSSRFEFINKAETRFYKLTHR